MRESAAAVAIASLPCVLFDGVLEWEDFAVSQLWLPLGALAQGFFVSNANWGWGWDSFRRAVNTGRGPRLPSWVRPYMAYAVPSLVAAVLAAGLFIRFVR